jgi:hypothetical protein
MNNKSEEEEALAEEATEDEDSDALTLCLLF